MQGKSPELYGRVLELLECTPLVDTHEHLMEERERIAPLGDQGPGEGDVAADFSVLLGNYPWDELAVAGMPQEEIPRFYGFELDPDEKWRLIEPWYRRLRHGGYARTGREALRLLFDEEELSAENYRRVSEKVRQGIRPGFYREYLREKANVRHCQVNYLRNSRPIPFFNDATEDPELLAQDLSILCLTGELDVDRIARCRGREIASLTAMHEAVDWAFESFGPRAVAVKDQSAYSRGLDFDLVSEQEAAPIFERLRNNPKALPARDLKAVQDHLFHYAVRKAGEYDLPVKLHTGFLAGHASMNLHPLRHHGGDLSRILMAHPTVRFDLFHILFPYQDELITLCKQHPNAHADLCWAWAFCPRATRRFLKDFITTAPVNKVFGFGGDHDLVEMSVGHAVLARKGIARALAELVEEDWLAEDDLPELAAMVCHRNAEEFFPYERALGNWRGMGA